MRTKDDITPTKNGRKWVKIVLPTFAAKTTQRSWNEALPDRDYLFSLHGSSTLEGPISEVLKKLQTVRNYYEKEGYRRITLDIEDDRYEGGIYISLHGYRLETKAEADKRKATAAKRSAAAKKREAKKKQTREEKERKEYERLKKKYGRDDEGNP